MPDNYCSQRFKTGEELDKALAAALCSCDDAARAEAAAARAEEIQSKVDETVSEALTQAKESGEFDGAPGQPGKDGKDGYTPQRGVDYWTEADKAEIKAEVGGGGVSSWNDLNDKPFGEAHGVLFDGHLQDSLNEAGDGWLGEMIVEDTSDNTLIVGETYTVTWNGVEYELEAVSLQGMPVVGNTVAVGGEDNGVPFVLGRDANNALGGGCIWVAALVDVPTDLTISGLYACKIEGLTVKPLDAKYIPTDVVRSIVNEVINDALSGEY